MSVNDLAIGASAKVKKLTGRYSKYLTRPTREGIITAINPNSVRIKFLHSRRDRSYHCHEHSFNRGNVEVTRHHKNSKRGKELEALRQEERSSQEKFLDILRRHNPKIDRLAKDIRKE